MIAKERSRPNLIVSVLVLVCTTGMFAWGATTRTRYYAQRTVEDAHGVIAPWYQGQNGLVDLRVRVSAEFLKRYPWVGTDRSVMAGPHWVFNARVDLEDNGEIKVLPASDNMNGNLAQRFKYITEGLPRYYRYTGDPVVFPFVKLSADFLLDNYMTPSDHPWPKFPISVPLKGKPYSSAAPGGWIQLDLSAGVGLGMIRAYQLTGEARYLEAAKHIGDVFAQKCNHQPGASPWNRYAELGEATWCNKPTGNILTGGVANIMIFLEELMRLGYRGQNGAIEKARDAGVAYLRDTLLPAWSVNDTWGRHYWDWEHPVQGILPTGWVAQYILDHKDLFPNWKYDVRNILSLYLNRSTVSDHSQGDVYSGAWAYPEGSSCCGLSLDICPVFLARFWARYAVEADSAWAREIVRRKTILSFYHFHESGKAEDNIFGGQITAREWSELIGFGPILTGLEIMAWLPEIFAPARENHLVHSSAVVTAITYGKGNVEYVTFDAPANSKGVLRLAFAPDAVKADGKSLAARTDLQGNGYVVRKLPGGDVLVSIRHDGATRISVTGKDPQQSTDNPALTFSGNWQSLSDPGDSGGSVHYTDQRGATVVSRFTGNQVRVVGRADADGGKADIYVDGVKQLVGIDCWNFAKPRKRQVLYYRNGLSNGPHELKIVARGDTNPYASGSRVYIDEIQHSAERAVADFGAGGGPTEPQRMIFGYTGRDPYVDKSGNRWLPATEFVTRLGHGADSVAQTWYTEPSPQTPTGTADPELYRYGVHAQEFWANITVAPGMYRVVLRFAERRAMSDPKRKPMDVFVNYQTVASRLDIAAKAGGSGKALDLTFYDIRPENGVIEVRFKAPPGAEAMVQAMEVVRMPAGY